MKRTRILLAIDESDASTAAVGVAGRIAIALKALVFVLDVDHVDRADTRADSPDDVALRQLTSIGVAARLEVRAGDPADEIVAAASGLKCDMIVMGSRGRSNLTGVLFGSVSQQVLERATCPVLLVRAGVRAIQAPCSILLALEGLEGSAPLLDVTARLAHALEARVTVVHVSYPGGENLERALYHATKTHGEQALIAAVSELSNKGVTVDSDSLTAVSGVPRAIARYANRIEADVIVMGAHAPAPPAMYAGIGESIKVAHISKRPVLVTREQDTA